MARTKTDLQIENAKLLAHIGELNAQLADERAHVKRLQLIIAKHYAGVSPTLVTAEQLRWKAAAKYAREHPGTTVQAALANV